ncbi:general transcription factor iie subunit 1-like [Plakobranchus ocellatus]|uniref:General transcription factor iie subunit 1-like n=1 Tax=Plakobranchus ocellatus TaxID=259542 RepID=A0AAV4ALB9_9GAST|nr:general transcription factor iie subunit 1-like [Plakobranchus ocellatus]
MEGGETLLTTVPEELKRLVRLIVRGFYTMEHAVVIDMLVRHPCVKEDDLSELLKLDKKHLRAILNMLKTDRFLKSKMRVETDDEGRTTKHTFYYINYSVFVNVVKYKLDHMRRKIETDERDNTSRSSFICTRCKKTYTDYEVKQLMNFETGELHCIFCNTKVEEDESSVPRQDARTLLAKFNEQIQPVVELLKVLEDVRLAPEVLEPEPTDIKKFLSRSKESSNTRVRDGDKTGWSGDASRKVDFGYSKNRVTITMDDDKASKVEKKDQPLWMTKSTVDGATVINTGTVEMKSAEADKRGRSANGTNDDILQALLVHEPQAGPSSSAFSRQTSLPTTSSRQDSSGEDSDANAATKNGDGDVEEMDSDDDDDGEPMVSIGSNRVPYNSVTSEMVATMTPLEKEEYIRIGQQLYENMYD